MRRLVRETQLGPAQLVQPLFVRSGRGVRQPVGSMPGVCQTSVDEMLRDARQADRLGIGGVLLFGIPDVKDAVGSSAWDDHGPVQEAVRALKRETPRLVVITDVCMCEYTDHGHCGVLKDGDVDNDATLDVLVKEALSHARAGADVIAPSDMMDGRVGAIRGALDGEKFSNIPILSYAAKFASGCYGPFREAAESTPQEGDRRGYQMDSANVEEAMREVRMDIEEGADMIMVKPALAYMDIIREVREATLLPVAAYNVSGEYSMVKAAAAAGYIDERAAVLEILTSLRRAGAEVVISYHAKDAARWMAQGR